MSVALAALLERTQTFGAADRLFLPETLIEPHRFTDQARAAGAIIRSGGLLRE